MVIWVPKNRKLRNKWQIKFHSDILLMTLAPMTPMTPILRDIPQREKMERAEMASNRKEVKQRAGARQRLKEELGDGVNVHIARVVISNVRPEDSEEWSTALFWQWLSN